MAATAANFLLLATCSDIRGKRVAHHKNQAVQTAGLSSPGQQLEMDTWRTINASRDGTRKYDINEGNANY